MSQSSTDAIRVRVLTAADIPFADTVRALAGWNQTVADWRRFLATEPEGCFIAERRGSPAGTATTASYGIELGWIGMLLVHPEHRRQGVGSALLQRSIEHLRNRGIGCIKLDATPLGKALYEQFGFAPELGLTRFEHAHVAGPPASQTAQITPLKVADWPDVLALDRPAFGCDRNRVLRAAAEQSVHAVILRSPDARVIGYGMLREGSRAFYLGPVVAETPEAAREIIHWLLAQIPGRPVYWDTLDENQPARGQAQTLGFKPQRPLLRMFFGGNSVVGRADLQFGLIDPAVG